MADKEKPPPTPRPLAAWTKAATIGPPKVGVRYALPTWAEIMASDHPLMRLSEWIVGQGRPRTVAAQDPYGIQAWEMGAGPPPVMFGTTKEVGPGITAYHGSPHDFEKFSLAKIGTGEGAQAYGHGLYFAEKEGTAKAYRDQLSTGSVELYGQEYPVPAWRGDMDPHTRLIRRLADTRSRHPDAPEETVIAATRQKLQDELASRFSDKPAIERELAFLDRAVAHPAGVKTSTGGRMYEVNIQADPAHFLDWDAPLKDQPESVRYLLGYEGRPTQAETDAIFALAKKRGVDPATMPEYKALEAKLDAAAKLERDYPNGRAIYDEWMHDERNVAIRQGRNADTTLPRSQEAASQALREVGIPGIKYLDQGSRMTAGVNKFGENWFIKGSSTPYPTEAAARTAAEAAGNVTRNFVVFDDAIIDIRRKYGLVAAAPIIEYLRRKTDAQGRLNRADFNAVMQ